MRQMQNEGTGSDRYVRIPTSELAFAQLRHLTSERDNSIAVPQAAPGGTPITGITEWVGTWRSQTVSVGWDWGIVDGLVVLLSQNEIRTNIQLISADGQPVQPCVAQIHLFHWIESLPWREVAVNPLLQR